MRPGAFAIVSHALALIEFGALDHGSVAHLARRLGCAERQLLRLFRQHLGVTPIIVAQSRCVVLARQLLRQTNLPLTQVALASGCNSVRCLNETFRWFHGRSPGAFRGRHATGTPAAGLTLLLPYRPPYDWSAMVGFLAARAMPGVDLVTQDRYARVVDLGDGVATIDVTHAAEHSALRVTLNVPRLDAVPSLIARVRRVFDLGADPGVIGAALSRDPALAPLVRARPGLRVPGTWDGFEIAVRAVLGQQITVKAATALAGRLVAALGIPCGDHSGASELTNTFPGPDRFAAIDAETLGRMIGMPRSRAATLIALADAARRDPELFTPRRNLDAAVTGLRALPGIGEWTAQYIAMRALRESDAFLAGDVALQRILAEDGRRPTARELLVRANAWRPWRAYAVLHLWTGEASVRDAIKEAKTNALAA